MTVSIEVPKENHANVVSFFKRSLAYRPPSPVYDVLWVLVFYPLLLALLLLGPLTGGKILSAADGDIAYYWLWQRYFLLNTLRDGAVPAWNPYIMAGTPFLGSLQSAVLYPLNALLFFVSVPTALNIQLVLHWWLSLVGWHLLGRRLGWRTSSCVATSVVASFSGWVVLHFWQGHLPFILEMAATPWLLWVWIGWKRKILSHVSFLLWTSAIVAVQFSVGHPQIVYFSLLVLAWVELWWFLSCDFKKAGQGVRAILLLAAGVALGSAIVAVQAIPTLLYMRETVRGIGVIPETYYTVQSMPWSNLFALIAPWVWGGWPDRSPYVGNESMWEVVGFVGATSFAIAFMFFSKPRMLSRFQWALSSLFILGLILSLGEYSGAYSLLRRIIPGLSLFRNPGRNLYLATIAVALLTGEGLERLRLLASSQRAVFLSMLSRCWVALAICVASYLIVFSDGIRSPIFMNLLIERTSRDYVADLSRESVTQLFQNFQVNLLGAGLMAALALGLISRLLWQKYSGVASWGLVALLSFELTQFARPYMVSFYPEMHEWPARVRNFLADNGARYRVSSVRTPADLDQGMRWKIRHVWGYEPTVSYRYAACLAVSQGRPPGFPEAWLNVSKITPLINALGVKYLIAPPRANLSQIGWKQVLDTIECSVQENEHALPRGYLVEQAKILSADEAVKFVNSEDFTPTSTVVLEREQIRELPSAVTLTKKAVKILEDIPGKFVAEVECDGHGWFVLMEQFLPGWKAKLDGKPVPIYRANACGMALQVPGGKHVISCHYAAPGVKVGIIVSVFGLFAYAILTWLAVKEKSRVSLRAQFSDESQSAFDK